MKQIIPYTQHATLSGLSIAWRKNMSTSFTYVSRWFLVFAVFCFAGGQILAQNCPSSGTHSQSVNENTYYPGTQASVAVGATSITLGAAGSGGSFGAPSPIAVGDMVLIIQMQGAHINSVNTAFYGANTGGGYGFLAAGLAAGTMEFAFASNAVPLAGGTLNLTAGTTNSYTYSAYGANGQYTYQVIRVPSYYNIQLTADISTPLWNGSIGGVTVINAVNQFNINSHTISALGSGFRGGAGRALSGASGTSKTDFMTLSTVNANGSKGEGIAGTTRYINNNGALLDNVVEGYPGGSYARGAPGNAGGGATDSHPSANDQNAGGGGGANGGNGGVGGWGWYSLGNTGGKGGGGFGAYASPSRLVMGGGGGAGTSNNATGTPGGGLATSGSSGGGMVILSATSISGTGTINASGADANNTVTNDASGGGGAGGSILIYANSGHAGITAIANGGAGGSNNPAAVGATRHGPGGGGGGGIIYSNAALNVASTVTAGANGLSTGTDATDNFGAASGNIGIMTLTFPFAQLPPNMQKCQITILPLTLTEFKAAYTQAQNVLVSWTTANQINTNYFEVERSIDGVNFTAIGQVPANQTEELTHGYSLTDYLSNVQSPILYYRLKMVDIDGKISYSKVVSVNLDQSDTQLAIYPNPATDFAVLKIYSDKQTTATIRLIDASGRTLSNKFFSLTRGNNSLMIDQISNLPRGTYFVQVMANNTLHNEKLIKK